jgi:hypothetical protein
MGYTWRANDDGTADAVEWDEFAEVVYEDSEVLVVSVARSVTLDPELEDALVDVLAVHDARHGAEEAIANVASAFGLQVHPNEAAEGQRTVVLAAADDTGVS